MKSTWRHYLNRWFRRRGGLPRSAKVQRPAISNPAWRAGAFGRSRSGRQEIAVNSRRWLWRAAMVGVAAGALWFVWHSWVGLGIFNQ